MAENSFWEMPYLVEFMLNATAPAALIYYFFEIIYVDKSYYIEYNMCIKTILIKHILLYSKQRSENMVFNTGAALLDAIVLAVVSREKEGTYGYKITQDVRTTIEVSESTLYPVLRRLQKDECLEVYDRQIDGRNRRYYKITVRGNAQLDLYRVEWKNYSVKINELFEGGITV